MKCPNCYSAVPNSAAQCPHCDWPLQTPPPPTSSAAFGQSPTANPWGRDETTAAPLWSPETPNATAPWLKDTVQPDEFQSNADRAQTEYGDLPLGSKRPPQAMPPFGGGSINASIPPVSTVPLTGKQKSQLLAGSFLRLGITTIFGFVFFATTLRRPFAELPLPFMLFILIFGLIFSGIVYQAFKAVRDVFSGVALVQTARLTKTQQIRNRNSALYYGYFEQLGKMTISRTNFDSAISGAPYRLTYSPATKRVWAMQIA